MNAVVSTDCRSVEESDVVTKVAILSVSNVDSIPVNKNRYLCIYSNNFFPGEQDIAS